VIGGGGGVEGDGLVVMGSAGLAWLAVAAASPSLPRTPLILVRLHFVQTSESLNWMKDSQTTTEAGVIVPHIRAIKRQKIDHVSGPFHRAVLQTLNNQVPGRSPDECWPVAREWERNPGKWGGRWWCSRRKCLREVFGEVRIHGRM
jgi:hypothetical protein